MGFHEENANNDEFHTKAVAGDCPGQAIDVKNAPPSEFPPLLKGHERELTRETTADSSPSSLFGRQQSYKDTLTIETGVANIGTYASNGNDFPSPAALERQGSTFSSVSDGRLSGTHSQRTSPSSSRSPKHSVQVRVSFQTGNGTEDEFSIGEHWMDLLANAIENSQNGKVTTWTSNYNVLHYACSKYNVKLCEFLLESPETNWGQFFRSYVHEIDDFDKKPLDHLRNAKGKIPHQKQFLADTIENIMGMIEVPDTDREKKYQSMHGHGNFALKLEHERSDSKGSGADGNSPSGAIADSNQGEVKIALGETGPDLTNILTAYEVESSIPQDMRKNFKVVAKTGFDNFKGSWSKGESPLHWAATRGRVDICRMLILVLKADPEAENGKGRSAIQLAKQKKHHQLAKMMHTLDFPIEKDADIQKQKEIEKAAKAANKRPGTSSAKKNSLPDNLADAGA